MELDRSVVLGAVDEMDSAAMSLAAASEIIAAFVNSPTEAHRAMDRLATWLAFDAERLSARSRELAEAMQA